MNQIVTAGSRGHKVRNDCWVSFNPQQTGGLDIHIGNQDESLQDPAKESLVRHMFQFYGIEHGHVVIDDADAPDFVLAARVEACFRQVITGSKSFLPDMLSQNQTSSHRKRLRLSRLYVPGNTPKMMIKAATQRPYAIILDLEDAVAAEKKDEARLLVRNALHQIDFGSAERMVRINQLPLGLTDLEQVVPHYVHVILIPKCESSDDIFQVNEKIVLINETAPVPNEIFLMPIIESAKGVLNAAEIAAAAENVVALAIGLEDYTADLGVQRTSEGTESFYARSHLVNVCKAYEIQAIDSVFSDVGDMEGLKQCVARSKILGFEGMGCIHPSQLDIVHAGYAPTEAEIEKARRIVTAFDQATQEGLGVISLGTKMIDPPIVERAQQTIASAIALGKLSETWKKENA